MKPEQLEFKIGDIVYFFTEIERTPRLISDEIRAKFITDVGVFYSRSSNPYNFGAFLINNFSVNDRKIYRTREEALKSLDLQKGEGTNKAE